MTAFFIYFVQVMVVSGALYGYYHFFLRNKRFHQYNRFFLLGSTVVSLIAPLLRFDFYFNSSKDIPVVYQLLSEVRTGPKIEMDYSSHFFDWENIVGIFFWLLTTAFIVRLILAFVHIRKLRRSYPAQQLEHITFVNTQEHGTPFSLFNCLFWNNKISLQSDEGQKIFRHELFHIQQKHSWDIIYLELLSSFVWVNPFYHLIKKETRAIHEFLADQFAAGTDNKWEYAELLVMQTLRTRQRLVNPFFHNQIKRRIAMITNSSKPSYQYLRKILVLPLSFFLVAAIAVNCTSKDVKKDMQRDETGASPEQTESIKQHLGHLRGGIKDSVDSQIAQYLEQLKKDLIEGKENKIASLAEVAPSFIGGDKSWKKFIQATLNPNVPVDHGAPEGTYKVMMQFVVDENGKVSDLKPLTHYGYGMEEEVLRVMKLSPDWTPAMQNGHKVKAYKQQPITFFISSE